MGLMDGTYSYSALVHKYGQFLVPTCKLKVDGRELDGVGVTRLDATLSLEGASAVSFEVSGAYDLKRSGFRQEVKNRLKLGSRVSLSLGYGSALTEIFQGYISGVGVDFSDQPVLSITAMDVRRLMMEGTSREVVHTVTSYSAAFEEVMQRYSVLCPSREVDATDSNEITQIVQRTSDYDFIASSLSHKANREFFVLDGKAYFRKKGKVKQPLTTLTWGESLLSFSRNSFYQNLKITVIGFDAENDKAVKAQVTEKSGDPQKTVGAQHEVVITDPDAQEAAKAKKRAEKEAQERRRRARTGSLSCVGLPELVPGRFLSVKGLDSELNRDYYIREVRHEFGSDGFSTSVEIGDWD
jgi:Phage protein D